MKTEDSVLVRAVMDKANDRIRSGDTTKSAMEKTREIDEIAHTVLLESPELITKYAEQISKRATQAATARRTHDSEVRRKILKRFWNSFQLFREVLAVAEVANRVQFEAISEWKKVEPEKKFEPPFGDLKTTGGVGTKCLLLSSLEARAIVVAQEILELLTLGFTEAASSRARTLHEITVITTTLAVGSKASNKYLLSDRYHLSSLIEQRKKGMTSPETRELTRKIKQNWGRGFFDQYGWARPVLKLKQQERPTFAHIERYAKKNAYRPLYLEFNDSVHAGALNTIRRSDFRLRYPNLTRPDCNVNATGFVLHTALMYLEDCTYVTVRDISSETCSWDNGVLIGILDRMMTPIHKHFSNQ